MALILVVDDDRNIIESFKQLFKGKHEVLGAYNGNEALEMVKENEVDIVFLDYRLPGDDGLKVLKEIKEQDPTIYIVMISAFGDFETIIQATSIGAYDYMEKPLDIERINIITERILQLKKMTKYVEYVRDEHFKNYNLNRIIGRSRAMQNLFKKIGKLVDNDVTVLIRGESGTGKELIARAIHYNGNRKNEPFFAVNCSGLSETLLDNELFGHEAQAYTGAYTRKIGKFEAAGEGTIFLDEIGDMPLSIQTKLLRVLQEREFQRLGGIKNIPLKARVISATNRDLEERVKNGDFREDLYYRLNVATIKVPPLRERKEDIPELVNYFIENVRNKLDRDIRGISRGALKMMMEYDWPGNVRELENVITNLCINADGGIIHEGKVRKLISRGDEGDIFENFVDKFLEKYSGKENLLNIITEKLEDKLIERLREKLGDNKTAIAKALGISRVTLQKKWPSHQEE